LGSRQRKVSNHLDFILQWAYSCSTDEMSKELQLWHTKETLTYVDEKSMCRKTFEHQPEVLEVLFRGGASNQ
jgi:hypothetical protein